MALGKKSLRNKKINVNLKTITTITTNMMNKNIDILYH